MNALNYAVSKTFSVIGFNLGAGLKNLGQISNSLIVPNALVGPQDLRAGIKNYFLLQLVPCVLF